MKLYFHTKSGQWVEPTFQNEGEKFPDGYAEKVAASVAETLGTGALTAVVTDDGESDPRGVGVRIAEVDTTPPPEPSLLDILIADKNLEPETRAALMGLRG